MTNEIDACEAAEDVLKRIEQILNSSIRWSRVFNSICSRPHKLASEIFCAYVDTNLGDKRIFPGLTYMERCVVETIGTMLNLPRASGQVTSGGTEANLLALFAAKKRTELAHSNEIIVSPQIHYSINKAAALMDLKVRHAALTGDGTVDPQSVRALLSDKTLAVIATAGTSELGVIDPTAKIADALVGHPCWFHVDAATGGFILPFRDAISPDHEFDFSIGRVDSITVDPHKYGFAPIPSGALCFRRNEDYERIEFPSFFADSATHRTILGTRCGGALAATYGILLHLGYDGFRAATQHLDRLVQFTTDKLAQIGYELLHRPSLPIFGVRISHAADVARRLEAKGWIVSVSKTYTDVLRVVLHHHHDEACISDFLNQLVRVSPPTHKAGHPCNHTA